MVAALVSFGVAGWSPTLHLSFLVMVCCCLATGVRLDELTSEECYKRANFVWLDKVTGDELPNTVATSRSRRNGDLLRGRSVESKCDPHNVVWGSRFMWFRYDDTNPLNFAWRWSQWETEHPAPEGERHKWPAFSPTGDGTRYGWAQATALFVVLMTFVMGAAEALLHSFHAIRVTIATCLLSMKLPDGSQAISDGSIQMFVRWKTAESMRIYARMSPADYADSIDEATRTDAAPHKGAGLPTIGPEEAIAQMEEAINDLERRPRRESKVPWGDEAVAAPPLRHDGLVNEHGSSAAVAKKGKGKQTAQMSPRPIHLVEEGRPPKVRPANTAADEEAVRPFKMRRPPKVGPANKAAEAILPFKRSRPPKVRPANKAAEAIHPVKRGRPPKVRPWKPAEKTRPAPALEIA